MKEESQIVAEVVEKLRSIREEQGISQAELSRRTGLSRSGIRHMEDGDVTPTLLFLLRISRELRVDIGGIISESTSPFLGGSGAISGLDDI